MTPFELILCLVIVGLLFLCAWQSWHHERTMLALMRDSHPEPLRWSAAPTQPVPLVVRRGSGWGTLMDIAPTKAFRPSRLPSFTLQEFGGVTGVPLAQEKEQW